MFINQSIQNYPDGALSLGWTTNDNVLTNYTWKDVFQAYSVLKLLNLIGSSTEVTFGKYFHERFYFFRNQNHLFMIDLIFKLFVLYGQQNQFINYFGFALIAKQRLLYGAVKAIV